MNKELIKNLAQDIENAGGRAYFVGGFVRDILMGYEPFDADIEVHGLEASQLEEIIDIFGERLQYGKSFGIYSLKGENLDIALPRRERQIGVKHTDFDVDVSPFIGPKKACERRDFTINAMMMDVLTGEILDFYGGKEDLKNKIIRHVNPVSFSEDALRVLRGAQFAARFNFTIASETIELCKTIDLSALSKERVFGEMKKALMKSYSPSVFFQTLRQVNGLSVWFSSVENLIGIEQNPVYHPEGDVWNHTMEVLDRASKYRDNSNINNPMGFMLGALVHDFGKAVTTEFINGNYHSYNHEVKGLSIASDFLDRLTDDRKLKEYALNLLELHMRPNSLIAQNSKMKTYNKLFDSAIDPNALIYLSTADAGHDNYINSLFHHLDEYNKIMSTEYVTGKDLINAGIKPGKNFGKYMDYSHKLRLSGVDKQSALKTILKMQ